MPEPTEAKPISWEAVKALAMVVGVREAARRMELSEDQVRQRSCREGWLKSPEAKAAVAAAHANRSAAHSLATRDGRHHPSPAALIQQEIAGLGQSTKLGFARAIAGVAEHVAQRDPQENLADAGNVKAAAQTADLVHGWKDQPSGSRVRLDVLLSRPEQTIDIQAEVVGDTWDSDVPQDTAEQ